MFTFPIPAVRKVIERGIADATPNGGFRNPYYGTRPGEGETPGIWLVGDQGVYIMSNGKLADGMRPLVVYAEECHPTGNPDWWHYKERHFGDDGIEFLEADGVLRLINADMALTHLRIGLTDSEITLTPIRR